MSRIVIIAGESSGDLLGSILARELRNLQPDTEISALGGQLMREAGCNIVSDVTHIAAFGLVETIKHLHKFRKVFHSMLQFVQETRPDALVLIDFPEFNLRFAPYMKKLGIPVIYYVSPQLWAWRTWRLRTIARYIDKMLVIFDFERRLYEKYGVDVEFVGHPLLDTIPLDTPAVDLRSEFGLAEDCKIIGLLPGSRTGEFNRLFPIILAAAKRLHAKRPDTEFIVGLAPSIPTESIQKATADSPITIRWLKQRSYDIMKGADLLITASGTATLEAAMFGTPMVVIYRVTFLTFLLLHWLVQIERFALCNIVAEEEIVPELMQWRLTPLRLARVAEHLLTKERLESIREQLGMVRRKLGTKGASRRAAEAILNLIATR